MYSQGYLALKRLECAMSVELSASTPIRLRSVISSISSLMKACIALKSDRAALSCKLCSEIILKFHWVDGLTTHPLTKLERVNLADDPIPFIKLVNPPAALTLSVESSLGSLFARRP
jgi:hypothetical protein